MRNFLIGLFVGMIVATGVSAFAQLAPFDAPLKEQLNGMRAEAWLRNERALDLREALIDSEPLLDTFGKPCRK